MRKSANLKNHITTVRLKHDWSIGFLGALACLTLALVMISGKFEFDTNLPYIFHGDGLSHQIFVTRLSEGWWTNNDRQGFPFGSNHLGYPISENAILLILKIFLTLGLSVTTSINIIILMGFPFAFLTTFFVLKSFKLNTMLSFVGGVLYTFTFFHVHHFMHFMYASYFVVPIYFWICFQLIVSEKRSNWLSNRIKVFCFLIVLSSFATYFVIFGSVLLIFTTLFFLNHKRIKTQLADSAFVLFSLLFGLVVNFLPSIWFYLFERSGGYSTPIVRSRTDADVFSFRLAQLLLPNQEHIIPVVKENVLRFNESIPWAIHTYPSSLGLYAAFGLVISFFVLFSSIVQSKNQIEASFLARMAWLLVLVGTIGGLGPILSYIGFEQIRHWQRISIFVAFSCVAISCFTIQYLIRNVSKSLKWLVCALLVLFGIIDQVGGSVPFSKSADTEEYVSSGEFIAQIEMSLPNASAVYNLPFVEYPETIAPGTMQTYHQGLGLIGSKSLKWSYGTMKGSIGDDFWRSLSNEDIETQIRIVKRLGFAGVYVDLRGYEDGGRQIVSELVSAGGYGQMLRNDGRTVFFKINNNGPLIASNLDAGQIQKIACYKQIESKRYVETC